MLFKNVDAIVPKLSYKFLIQPYYNLYVFLEYLLNMLKIGKTIQTTFGLNLRQLDLNKLLIKGNSAYE